MGKYISNFNTTSAYEAAESTLKTPHLSLTKDNMQLHYKPWVETRIVTKFYISLEAFESEGEAGGTTTLFGNESVFSSIEINGLEHPTGLGREFSLPPGEHILKYTLTDPTKIGISAFRDCTYLTSVIIPLNVTRILSNAFQGCTSLTSITIPSSVTSSISPETFSGCSSLTSVTLSDSVTSIGMRAFEGCSGLTSVMIPDSVTTIGNYAFQNCSGLTSVTIPSSVTSIGSSAFYSCSGLTNITCNASTAPTITNNTFRGVKTGGTLYVPSGSTGYDVWMGTGKYYLGKYGWTKVEQ